MMGLSSCSDDPEPAIGNGNLVFKFEHKLDGDILEFDQMQYVNAALNEYEVSEIQWFISDITLHHSTGNSYLLDSADFAHYIDTDILSTWEWQINDPIPVGDYNSLSMTFGIKGEKNVPLMFNNPPESDMLWPYQMGGDQGGYHYMKLNGFWKDPDGLRQAFNFHFGVGQEQDENGNNRFVQNWFELKLENAFSLSNGQTKVITIDMNIENWFQDPHIYDHNEFGGKIMDNQKAMNMGCENGRQGVFAISSIDIR